MHYPLFTIASVLFKAFMAQYIHWIPIHTKVMCIEVDTHVEYTSCTAQKT